MKDSRPNKRDRAAGRTKPPKRQGQDGKRRSGGRRSAPPAPRRRSHWTALKWLLVAIIWAGLGLGGVVAWYAWDLPDIAALETPGRRPSVTLLAADGSTIARIGEAHGGAVRFADLPPHLVQAVVATEDRRFFEHGGVDPWGLLRAAFANLKAGAVRQGGSTITQQLAKNLFLTPARTIRRKAQEVLAALWLESTFTKRQIFAIYASRVYLGSGVYGMEAAARRYFAKSVRDATLFEAAVLAGLLKAPSRYSPMANPKAAVRRAEVVLANMVAAGYLSADEARTARRRSLRVRRGPGTGVRYFADWAFDRAAGYIGRSDRDLVVVTTLDSRLQRIAETRLAASMRRQGGNAGAAQAALVALAPGGAVRAMVGGHDYRASQFNRATQALRQPGSAFKLFVYLAGLEAGLTPDSRLIDGPVAVAGWRPRNYDDRYLGATTLRQALARSLNTVAVRVSERAGRDRVLAAARRLGITSKLTGHPSLALGAGEVTLIELTAAYAAIANRGRAAWPHAIVEIRDSAGEVLFRRAGSGAARVVAPAHVAALNDMLGAVIRTGTGRKAAIGRPAAGKTGTSQDFRDAWFVGYTADLVAGVWVGNDDDKPMRRVTGGGLPAGLWRGFMSAAHRGWPVRPLAAP